MDKSTQTEGESVKRLSVSTLDLLRCNKCRKYLSSSPVHSFEDGRNLCKSCYGNESGDSKRMKHICNSLYTNTVKELDFPCQYANEGCVKTIRFDDQHNQKCVYGRLLKCPIQKDGFEGSVENMKEHLKSEHQDLLFNGNEIVFTVTRTLFDPYNDTRITVDFVQPFTHYFTVHKHEREYKPVKETKILLDIAGRMFVVGVDVFRNNFNKKWALGIGVSEITYEKCREKFTLTFKNEPDFIQICRRQIEEYLSFCPSFVQNLETLFELSTSPRIFCTIALDIPYTRQENQTTDDSEMPSQNE